MSSRAADNIETCEIAWWRGYVKGRFQAYATSTDGLSHLIAESPPIPWRSSAPPGPTNAAVDALGVLTELLSAEGWTVSDASGEPWFRLVLAREGELRPSPDDGDDRLVDEAPAPPPLSRRRRARQHPQHDVAVLDAALLDELRAELEGAREQAQRERDRRLAAETKALRLVEPAGAERAAPAHPASPPPAPVLVVAYAIAIVAAAVVGLVGFESAYGAVVAGLTVLALSIAVDSWIAARRRTAASH
jgi:hypothetical protein